MCRNNLASPQAEVTLSWLCPHVFAIFLRLHPTTTPHATSHDYSGLNAIHITSISQHALELVSISGACLHAGFYGSTDSTQKRADPPWNSLDRHGGGLALCAHRFIVI